MDLDLDLDSPWPEDPNPFNHNSTFSTFNLLSQPISDFNSPLWVFSDSSSIPNTPFSPANLPEKCNPDASMSKPMKEINPRDERNRLEIELTEDLDGSCTIKKRMMQALRYFKESTEQHVLVQVWAPVKTGDRYVLTTSGQPFVLDANSSRLLQYRTVSLIYCFSLGSEGEGELGLPGRVFLKKLPEWTPNVQYYSRKEYPRLNHAMHYNVRGTLALPVFEPSGQSCVGVVELIMTAQKINYAPEVNKVCKALEICNEGRQAALAEILVVLIMVCETHKLPLAQTWVPCRHRSVVAHGGGTKKSCSSFDGSCMGQVCLSTTDVAFYIVDAQMWGFRDACAEHHLQKGQGVPGRVFTSHKSCFSGDITQFSKTRYPLVHYARIFGLAGCLAICLRSMHTGSDDYILEFFLPPDCKDKREQLALLDWLSATMKHCFRSLKFVYGEELQSEQSLEIIDAYTDEKYDMKIYTEIDDVQNREDVISDSLGRHCVSEVDAHKNTKKMVNSDARQTRPAVSESEYKGVKRISERRRGKSEKSISLEVLQKYFAGSLKDAAKKLGVCPTTMKRICRQHGISRWPSRKINKVNRSLFKIKRVIESVQGVKGAFTLTSLDTSSLPVAVGSISWPINLNPPTEREEKCPTYGMHVNGDHEQFGFQQALGYDFNGSKTRSSSVEESTEAATLQDSCQGNPTNERKLNSSAKEEQLVNIDGCFELTCEPIRQQILSTDDYLADVLGRLEPEALNEMLFRDSGSCKDFRMLLEDDQKAVIPPALEQQSRVSQDPKTVTVKARYREDIIRFRLPLTSGVVELKEEVAKRLKLEIGTFDIKYLDDDHEWVLLACDADLQECKYISRSLGVNLIRLLVHHIVSELW